MDGILGKKLGMTQVYSDEGRVIPVTVVKAGPCLVVQRRTEEHDGYEAVQLGLVEDRAPRRVSQPMRGHFDKAKIAPMRKIEEFELRDGEAGHHDAEGLVGYQQSDHDADGRHDDRRED